MEKTKEKAMKKGTSKNLLNARVALKKKVARVAGAVYNTDFKKRLGETIKE